MPLYRRLLHLFDNHGLRGILALLLGRTPHASPREPAIHPFDLAHAVDTSGYLPGESLTTNTPADLYNTAYYAISPSTLIQALERLPFDPKRVLTPFTFVDLGCGKGRALLIAAHQGFSHLLGVELSPALAAVAQHNLPQAHILVGDAATVQYPPGPLLVFLYHPFLAPLLRRVLENLLAQHKDREIYLLYANPTYPRVLNRLRRFRLVWDLSFSLSAEDAAADRHHQTQERYTLYQVS
jgi:SAM-dependent methyltransferase